MHSHLIYGFFGPQESTNGISIGLFISAGSTSVSNTETDKHTDHGMWEIGSNRPLRIRCGRKPRHIHVVRFFCKHVNFCHHTNYDAAVIRS